MKIKIVADSSSDLFDINGVDFVSAPLKIITDEREFIDNKELDTEEMVNYLLKYKGKSSSSCPSPQDWLNAFGDSEEIYCITITSELSGSYNAANIAKSLYQEKFPDSKVFVFNSLSTGPEMKLIIEKIKDLIFEKRKFNEICDAVTEYCKKTGLIFMLESMKNLANNGRVSSLAAKAGGILGIRAIGKASDKGDLESLDKCRGEAKALESILFQMKKLKFNSGKVRIAHCLNLCAAEKLKSLILREFKNADIEIYSCGGLCSFYAEKGGMIIGFEKA